MDAATKHTVHWVLESAYAGHRPGDLLTHASADRGLTAVCGRVQEGSLCDQPVDTAPTCPVCARKLAPGRKGRPRLATEVSGKVVGVRLTEEAYAQLQAAAAAANTSMSELLRLAWERSAG